MSLDTLLDTEDIDLGPILEEIANRKRVENVSAEAADKAKRVIPNLRERPLIDSEAALDDLIMLSQHRGDPFTERTEQ